MLFVHDHTFVEKDGMLYTTGSLNQKIMDRYKSWFGSVSVFATTRIATEKDSAYIRVENYVNDIDFHLVPKRNNPFYFWTIRKKIEKEVKHSNCLVSRMSIFGAIAVHYARKHSVPYMIEMVACPWDSLWYHSLKGKLLAPFMTLLTKRVCWRAPRVLYVTDRFLQSRYPTQGVQVGCSDVELTDINDYALEKRLKKIKNRTSSEIIKLCTVANINVRYKGQDLVIKSLKRLRAKGIKCEYYLIGGGDPSWISDVINESGEENNVFVVGPKPHEEIFSILDNIDIYIQPSLQEGLPRAVIEAMSRGCPIIGSSTGGIPELIDSSCVFKKGDEQSFIHTITQMIEKDTLLENAVANFQRSKKYAKNKLDAKRDAFYKEFATEALEQ